MNKTLLVFGSFVIILIIGIGAFFLAGQPDQSNPPKTNTQITQTPNSNNYQNFSPSAFEAASDKKRVYFFYAAWCPYCQAADKAFRQNLDKIPNDVVIFITDYDTQTELKSRYTVTYQHTFVQVDSQGNVVSKWSGGDIDSLLANLK